MWMALIAWIYPAGHRADVPDSASYVRALGLPAPFAYADFAARSSIREERGVPPAEQMIHQLVEGQEVVIRTARTVYPLAERIPDQVTADLLTKMKQVHERTARRLRSLLS